MNEKKYRFIVVGSGWRSLFFARIARALPDRLELCAMLCRMQEKADLMKREHGVYATASKEECIRLKPDFVVVAVGSDQIAEVSREWMDAGFAVLCETPAALTVPDLQDLWKRHLSSQKLVVAEQYSRYPVYQSMIRLVQSGLIGETDCIHISAAHEYHAANLVREFLNQKPGVLFTVSGKTYSFPSTETMSRYERFTDGRTAMKERTVAVFEFEDGKVWLYDFDSDQYRSPIRKYSLNVQGRKGELKDADLYYLDENGMPGHAELVLKEDFTETGDPNPNLARVREITEVSLVSSVDRGFPDGKWSLPDLDENAGEVLEKLYEPPFGLKHLSEDETAIAGWMLDTGRYAEDSTNEEFSAQMDEALRKTLEDSYMTILLRQAVREGTVLHSERQPWHKSE